jgi:uncharacterized glyoxalase superfamily protein PhnB
MKPPPKNFPRITPGLTYDDARAAIDWLCKAFGFEVQLKVEGDDGSIEHSELRYGEGVIMISSPKAKNPWYITPAKAGGTTASLMIYVDDIEAHHKRVMAAGGKEVRPIETHDYGDDYWVDRSYGVEDPGGHHWWIAQRIKGLTQEEPASPATGGARRAEH